MSLLDFKMRLAEDLIKANKKIFSCKRGRPSSISTPVARKKLKFGVKESRPFREIQYDTIDHMPQLGGNKEGKRCKHAKCNKKTYFFCDKSNVHLCIKKERNCFSLYHRKLHLPIYSDFIYFSTNIIYFNLFMSFSFSF